MVQPGSKGNYTAAQSMRLQEFAPNSSYTENTSPFQKKDRSRYGNTGCTFNPIDDNDGQRSHQYEAVGTGVQSHHATASSNFRKPRSQAGGSDGQGNRLMGLIEVKPKQLHNMQIQSKLMQQQKRALPKPAEILTSERIVSDDVNI